jgi:uncharacterized protein (DUF2132 family)
MIEVQRNNPLHGVKLEALLTELVDHYGWEAMASEFNFNCFKSNPSIKSSLKFLRKTAWAREKVESFYLYQYKGLPRASVKEEDLPPRDRTIPLDQKPGKPEAIKARPKKVKPPGEKSKKDPSDIWGHWRK